MEFHDRRKLKQMLISLLFWLPEVVRPDSSILNGQLRLQTDRETATSDLFKALSWVMDVVIHDRGAQNNQSLGSIATQARKTVETLITSGAVVSAFRTLPVKVEDNSYWLDSNYIKAVVRAVDYCACPWAYYDKEPCASRIREMARAVVGLLTRGDESSANLYGLLGEGQQLANLGFPTELRDVSPRSYCSPMICRALVNVGLLDMLEGAPGAVGFNIVKAARNLNFGIEKREGGGNWVEYDGHWWRFGRNSQELHRTLTVIGQALQQCSPTMNWPEWG